MLAVLQWLPTPAKIYTPMVFGMVGACSANSFTIDKSGCWQFSTDLWSQDAFFRTGFSGKKLKYSIHVNDTPPDPKPLVNHWPSSSYKDQLPTGSIAMVQPLNNCRLAECLWRLGAVDFFLGKPFGMLPLQTQQWKTYKFIEASQGYRILWFLHMSRVFNNRLGGSIYEPGTRPNPWKLKKADFLRAHLKTLLSWNPTINSLKSPSEIGQWINNKNCPLKC